MKRTIVLDGSLEGWRAHARALLREGTEPRDVRWVDPVRSGDAAPQGLFESSAALPTPVPEAAAPPASLPSELVRRIRTVACFRSEAVWDALYCVVFRVARGERDLLDDSLDPEVAHFSRMEKAVRRDAHKMHAFVRFRRMDDGEARGGERFVAWYRPSHLIAEREATFFAQRFPSMDWSILTPDASVHFDANGLRFGPSAPRSAAPTEDELEDLWCTYYASVFNPARVKLKAMTAEMPRKFWDTLPETAQLPSLLADVPRRLEEMARSSRRMADSARPFVPDEVNLDALRAALPSCEGCELHGNGTRALLGQGPEDARIVLLGEQPGDTEEREGRPFVGPAGRVLDGALRSAGLVRQDLYITNAVKHFRHVPAERGKRRIHKRPTTEHVSRCQPWLDAEVERVRPAAMVTLGVTASRAVFGPTFRMPAADAPPVARTSRYAAQTFATFHPAAILRAKDARAADAMGGHLQGTLAACAAVGGSGCVGDAD